MQRMGFRIALGLTGWLLLCVVGCGTPIPSFVEGAQGTVTIDGQPLPGATVQFTPDVGGLGHEALATAVTDEKGHFELRCGDRAGTFACLNRVIVTEGPTPAKYRNMNAQGEHAQYLAGLKNRPIPSRYNSLATTPVEITVTEERKTYDVVLKRSKK